MRGWLGSMTCLRKPGKLPAPGAARVDEGGDAAGPRHDVGIDAERGAAPVDVGVEVDEAGRDDEAGDVADFGSGVGRQALAEGGDLASGKGNVHHAVEALRRVEHAAAAEDQFGFHVSLPSQCLVGAHYRTAGGEALPLSMAPSRLRPVW